MRRYNGLTIIDVVCALWMAIAIYGNIRSAMQFPYWSREWFADWMAAIGSTIFIWVMLFDHIFYTVKSNEKAKDSQSS